MEIIIDKLSSYIMTAKHATQTNSLPEDDRIYSLKIIKYCYTYCKLLYYHILIYYYIRCYALLYIYIIIDRYHNQLLLYIIILYRRGSSGVMGNLPNIQIRSFMFIWKNIICINYVFNVFYWEFFSYSKMFETIFSH